MNRFDALLGQGDLQAVHDAATEALASRPDDPEALSALAKVFAIQGDVARAEEWVNRSERAGASLDALLVRANLALQKQDLEGAGRFYEKALALAPRSAEAEYGLGLVRAGRGDLAGAEPHFDRAVAAQPSNAVFHYRLAQCRAALGVQKDVFLHLEKAIELNPAYAPAYLALAQILAAMKNAPAAIEVLRRGLRVLPGEPEMSRTLNALERLASAPAGPVLSAPGFAARINGAFEEQLAALATAPVLERVIAALRLRAIELGCVPGPLGYAPEVDLVAAPPRPAAEKRTISGESWIRARVESKLTAPATELHQVPAAAAGVPDLEHLRVDVPQETFLDEGKVTDRVRRLARAGARHRARSAGEPVALGDEVQLDLVWVERGQLVPFGVWPELRMELAPEHFTPGLAEAIAGTPIGQVARFAPPPGKLEVRAFVAAAEEVGAAGTAPDRDAVRRQLAQVQSLQNSFRTTHRVLDALSDLCPVEVPAPYLREALEVLWSRIEAGALERCGIPKEQQQAELERWVSDKGHRGEITRRYRINAALQALSRAGRIALSPEGVGRVLGPTLAKLELSADSLAAALAHASPEDARSVRELVWYLDAVDQVVSRAKVRFIPV